VPMNSSIKVEKARKRSVKRKVWTIGMSFMMIVMAGSFWAYYHVSVSAKPYIFDQIDKVPHYKVGLLLGTSKRVKGGGYNPYFLHRIHAASQLFHSGKIDYILVSGDNGTMQYNEPEDMRKELVQRKVPSSRIFLDYAGFRTFDSVIRAHKVFGLDSFVVISQKFHNERALFIAQQHGIQAVGFNAQNISARSGRKVMAREWLARSKVFLDMMTGKKPKYLGETISIP
jgi:SanA protein